MKLELEPLTHVLHLFFLNWNLRQDVLSRCSPSKAIEYTTWHTKLLFDDQNLSLVSSATETN